MNWKKLFKANYAQIFFVCAAFSLVVVIGSFSVSRVIQKESMATVTVALNETEKTIRSYMREPKIAFDNIYTAVQDMLDRGESQEAIQQYLSQTANLLLTQEEGVIGFNTVYGYIRDELISGSDVELSDDFVPQRRPWYQLAIRSTGAEYTAPYVDAYTGTVIISLVREIYGKNDNYYGVLSLDVDISWLMEYAESLQFTDGGYGMIINQYFYTIAHPNESCRNIRLQELGDGYAEVADMLRLDKAVSDLHIKDIDGTKVTVYFKQLYNGWFVGVVMPMGSYFADLYYNIFILAILGAVLSVILSVILLRLSAAKIQSEEESKSKSSFLARMSHEIRTPMNAILGMTELLLQKNLPEDVREDTYIIKHAGTNLLSIINDILDLSKIESNKMEIAVAEYEFASIINDVISIIRMRIKDKRLLFVVNINNKLPNILIGDAARISQILLNLLSNAVKYTNEGYVSFTVDKEDTKDDSIILSFKVADTGIGIKESDLDYLFNDFIRFDTLKNQNVEGTGLGLAISRRLCRLMGGDITVSSRYGEGSVFTATLPQKIKDYTNIATVYNPESHYILIYEPRVTYASSVVQSIDNLGVRCLLATTQQDFLKALTIAEYSFIFAASFLFEETYEPVVKYAPNATFVLLTEFGEISGQTKMHTISMPAHVISIANTINGVKVTDSNANTELKKGRFIAPTAKILVVDDIITNLQVAKGLMLPYKAQIDCCMSGKEAIERVLAKDYDLVFMDHMMPGMDGIEATEIIRSLDGQRFQNLPIVALTANAVSGMREMFLDKKFNDYLSKPIEVRKINTILDKWIPKEKLERVEYVETINISSNSGLEISGVDIDKGISFTGGSEKGYLEVLALYCRDAADRIEILSKTPNAENLDFFITQIHALKSASASIGATALSEQAFFLEEAGARKDIKTIQEHLSSFQQNLSALIESIQSVLPSKQTEDCGDEYIKVDKAILLKLKEALEAEDIRVIDKVLAEILSMQLGTKTEKVFSAISDNVFMSEFKDAVVLLDGILEEVLDE